MDTVCMSEVNIMYHCYAWPYISANDQASRGRGMEWGHTWGV